jgi:hypothetical protein
VIEPGASSVHESLFRRPAKEDPPSRRQRDAEERGRQDLLGEPLLRQTLRCGSPGAARREGKPLAPKKHPGSEPKLDERARKILEADAEERPAITLKDRCRFLEEMVGVSVSESTLSRLLRKMGLGPKDGAWVHQRGTSS